MGGGEGQTYCLRWNNHKSNLVEILEGLFKHESYVDCTLRVDDGKFFVHRIILAANSAYFQTILQDVPMEHCTILFPGVKKFEMKPLLDYMYTGEVNITQAQIQRIMQIARQLGVKGLYDMNEMRGKMDEDESSPPYSFKSSYPNTFDQSAIPSSSDCPPPPQWLQSDEIYSSLASSSRFPGVSSPALGSVYEPKSNIFPFKRKKTHMLNSMLGAIADRDGNDLHSAHSNGIVHTNKKTKSIPPPSQSPLADDHETTLNSSETDSRHTSYSQSPTNQKPEWKRYKQYTRADLTMAINAVRGGMSALQASRQFNVPSRTLYDKVKKMGIVGNRPTNRQPRRSPSDVGSPASFPYGLSGVNGAGSPQFEDQSNAQPPNDSEAAAEIKQERFAIDPSLLMKALEHGSDISGRETFMALAAANGMQSLRQSMSQSPSAVYPAAERPSQTATPEPSNEPFSNENDEDNRPAIRIKSEFQISRKPLSMDDDKEDQVEDLSIRSSERKNDMLSPPQSPISITSQSETSVPQSQQSVIVPPQK